ncbi:MAG: M20/M25/M40 family metallo-hydrolase [Flavobacteriaceae bacterium]
MKKYASIISLIIVLISAYWGFYDLSPTSITQPKSDTEFSIDNALLHLKNITKEVHYVGTEGHKNVQNYLFGELQKMGLNPTIQTQTVINKKWYAGTTTENIIAKIKGKENGKALLLLSHYDSSPNLAIGASDAGSGVVTILESVRAFLAKGEQPKNDIIILISDAEELGLLGAKAFVEHHPWAKEVELVLNFEARGSGGPSYMLMETNGKNSRLISEFLKANPGYPASNSLLYSIYKKLPNDTDLTVFRENGNINGFNFAFIGDHFDYHTMQDTYERLDRTTLAHQGDYLMTTLAYFANSEIENMDSDVDFVYVNFPFVKLLIYPFSWVTPMVIIAVVLLIILIFFGIVLNKIDVKQLLVGFIPSLLSIILCGGVSFLLWKGILLIHPSYLDILHGFTYNGYWYIAAFVCLNIWILFFIYKRFIKRDNSTSLLIAPIVIWLLVNFFIPEDFKGAGFFIIPVLIAEIILAITIFKKPIDKNYAILFAIISIPTVYIFAPLIKMFPVGLGLKVLFISGIILALVFGLLLPVLTASKSRNAFTKLAGVLAIAFFAVATFQSGFTIDKKKPNSLVYIKNLNDSTAYWGTYNQVLDSYISQKLGDNPKKGGIANASSKSKYNSRFSYHAEAENKAIKTSAIHVTRDTIVGEDRMLEFSLVPKRKINKYELGVIDTTLFKKISVNNSLYNDGEPITFRRGSFLLYHMGNSDDSLSVSLTIGKEAKLHLFMNEISYDLLENPLFTIQPRTEEMMTMPFITNNAIICTRQLSF